MKIISHYIIIWNKLYRKILLLHTTKLPLHKILDSP